MNHSQNGISDQPVKCYFKIQKTTDFTNTCNFKWRMLPQNCICSCRITNSNYWQQYTIAISLTGTTFSANKLTGHFILAIVQKIEVSNRIRNEVEGRNDASKIILACMVT